MGGRDIKCLTVEMTTKTYKCKTVDVLSLSLSVGVLHLKILSHSTKNLGCNSPNATIFGVQNEFESQLFFGIT